MNSPDWTSWVLVATPLAAALCAGMLFRALLDGHRTWPLWFVLLAVSVGLGIYLWELPI